MDSGKLRGSYRLWSIASNCRVECGSRPHAARDFTTRAPRRMVPAFSSSLVALVSPGSRNSKPTQPHLGDGKIEEQNRHGPGLPCHFWYVNQSKTPASANRTC